jgi:hypothetical protein
VIVVRHIEPEQEWSDEDGVHLCPPLVSWQIICPDHQCYTVITVQQPDLIELHDETVENFILSLVMCAKLDMEERDCFHDIPPLDYKELARG